MTGDATLMLIMVMCRIETFHFSRAFEIKKNLLPRENQHLGVSCVDLFVLLFLSLLPLIRYHHLLRQGLRSVQLVQNLFNNSLSLISHIEI